MRFQPVDLLADIRLGGQERGFHVQPLFVQIGAGVHKHAHLRGEPCANRRRLARRIDLGARA